MIFHFMSLGKYDLSKVPAIQWGRAHKSVAISAFTEIAGIEISNIEMNK